MMFVSKSSCVLKTLGVNVVRLVPLCQRAVRLTTTSPFLAGKFPGYVTNAVDAVSVPVAVNF
jgi:hypothetical protein